MNVINEHIIGFKERFGFRLIISRASCNGDAIEQTRKSMIDRLMIP
jgi:hypothetical protein